MRRTFRRLFADQGGAVAVMLALSLVPLTVAGLGAVDMAQLVSAKSQLQDAVDAAALAAARDGGDSDEGVDAVGQEMLARELDDIGTPADLSANFHLIREGKVVEAEATHGVDGLIFEKFVGGRMSVRVRALALRDEAAPCVLALNPTASKSLWVSGSFEVKMPECTAAVNSKSPDAFEMAGASYLRAKTVRVVGGAGTIGGVLDAKLELSSAAQPDPFKDVALPQGGGCDRTSAAVTGKSEHFEAGGRVMVFCDGLTLNDSTTFGSGVYEVRGGDLDIRANSVTQGDGVTFILTRGATVHIDGGANIRLTAPRNGALKGLLFFQERTGSGAESIFNGGAAQELDGALYFPKQKVRFNGNSKSVDSCLSLVADTIEWIGNAEIALKGCDGGVQRVRLLE